jgi:hypothetical protein
MTHKGSNVATHVANINGPTVQGVKNSIWATKR